MIGQTSAKLSQELKANCPEIPWSDITGIRNILVHHYFEIDHALVWSVVEKDLPDLKQKLSKILQQLDNG